MPPETTRHIVDDARSEAGEERPTLQTRVSIACENVVRSPPSLLHWLTDNPPKHEPVNPFAQSHIPTELVGASYGGRNHGSYPSISVSTAPFGPNEVAGNEPLGHIPIPISTHLSSRHSPVGQQVNPVPRPTIHYAHTGTVYIGTPSYYNDQPSRIAGGPNYSTPTAQPWFPTMPLNSAWPGNFNTKVYHYGAPSVG